MLAGAGLLLLGLLVLAYLAAPTYFAPDLRDADIDSLPPREQLAARNERLATQNQVRATSLQLVGGIVVLGGAIAAWYQVQLRRDDQYIAREGQITERFTRAIDQLGNADSLDIRLGGVHALARIAKDSHDDRPAVVAVLAVFIRQRAPARPITLEAPEDAAAVPSDARAASDALSRAVTEAARVGQHLPLDLRATDMTGISFGSANLGEAQLADSSLANANLRAAQLPFANLARTNLTHADLLLASLFAVDFTDADLSDADLSLADASGADFTGAKLRRASLTRATLIRANLSGTDVAEVDLSRADLTWADLSGADLTDANLAGADLTGANLTDAILVRADVTDAVIAWDHLSDVQRNACTWSPK